MNRVLRGDDWAGHLLGALGQQSSDVLGWMERETRVLKSDQHSRVGLLHLQDKLCYLKCYRAKDLLQQLQFRLGKGRGVASFDHAQRLRQAGLAVAEPLACVLVDDSLVLLTEGIGGSTDLKSLWVEGQSEERLQELMRGAAATLADWHGAGFTHGDCKWSNFLVADDAIYLVDLEAVNGGSLKGAGVTRDLARFTVNAEDMGLAAEHYRTFLESYSQLLGLQPDDLARRILPRLQLLRRRHLEKYGERGHPLL